MLEDLTIKDFAIIDHITIEFSAGLTALSGETGAGKSILIGALSFLLGGKAEVTQIRAGAAEASVTGTFFLDNAALETGAWLSEHGVEAENNRVLLRRFIRSNGKSGAWIGNTPVTRAELSEFSSFLIDIHGQHEHQSLMKVSEHRKFLDLRAGISTEVNAFTALYAALIEKRRILEQLNSDDGERLRKIDMYAFAVKEIGEADLKVGEDETLAEEEARLASYEKLYSGVEAVRAMLDESDEAAVPLLKRIRRECQTLSPLDKTIAALDTRLEALFYELSDVAEEFNSYAGRLVFDPARLAQVQERLSLIYDLKKKYASSQSAPLSEVFDYFSQAQAALEKLGSGGENKEALTKEIAELEKRVYSAAKALSEKRRKTALVLSDEVSGILKTLGMGNARFSVNVVEKAGSGVEQRCGQFGMDNIEFLISANEGSPLLPLSRIASGGELSRVMLALKTIFARIDTVPTLVFDEIDTGIGGEVAVAVGSHLKRLAESRQIFCITHLASIAVYADNQIKIEKGVEHGKTSSHVRHVRGDERVAEIARMLSGDADSEQSLEHARTMLDKCGQTRTGQTLFE
ncbi:MAG: DNA repair protein RecN [Treponema sp.]